MARKPNIRDISERAGVAPSTVSHVLNGTAPISDSVRARVLSVANEIGYLARRQAKGTIATLKEIMILAPEGTLPQSDVNYFSWTILRALTQDCEARGIKLVPFPLSLDLSDQQVAKAIVGAKPDGVIVVNDDRPSLLRVMWEVGLPVLLLNGEDPNMLMDSVTPANRFGAQMATNWLIGMGHRELLHLSWPGRMTVRRRLDGFLDAVREHEAPAQGHVVMAESYKPEHGKRAIADWLEQNDGPGQVTGIFCAADNLAFGALAALSEAGISVPGQVSVMGFDGIALGELNTPALTTVSVPLEQFGPQALALLEQQALQSGAERASRRVELGCRIIKRASVAAP